MPLSLDQIRKLRAEGRDEEAKEQLADLAKANPKNAQVLFEAASVHDFLDFEEQAVTYYIAAIEAGLAGDDLKNAYLGLGSTYRILGKYEESLRAFKEGLRRFPDAEEIYVFIAMTEYNLGHYHDAMSVLLRIIADTSSHPGIQTYERAIRLYATDLDRHSRSVN